MGHGIHPMANSQSEWDKFSGDRIPVNYIYLRSDLKGITKYTFYRIREEGVVQGAPSHCSLENRRRNIDIIHHF